MRGSGKTTWGEKLGGGHATTTFGESEGDEKKGKSSWK